MATHPKVGEIRPVFGGHGLMLVVAFEEPDRVYMQGHGPKLVDYTTRGHWFTSDQLGAPVDAKVVLFERAEARARNVSCNNSDCWCRAYGEGVS